MSVRKAISGSVSYKDLMKAGKGRLGSIFDGEDEEVNVDEEDMERWGMGFVPSDEPEIIPTEATKEIVKPLVLAIEDGGRKK